MTLPVEVAEVSDAVGTEWKYGTASFDDESISTAESADPTDVLNDPVSAVESLSSVNTSSTNVSDATWETAPACVGKPREETAVQGELFCHMAFVSEPYDCTCQYTIQVWRQLRWNEAISVAFTSPNPHVLLWLLFLSCRCSWSSVVE